MGIEQKINYHLNKYPTVKRIIKRAYQRTMYTISPKIKCKGNIIRISPNDPNHEYFFGYYDKSPWDATDRYMICTRAKNTWSDVSPREKADIIIIDTEKKENDPTRIKKIGESSSWNVQQSCMAQWLGPDFSSRILYNDFRDGKYVSVIVELNTGKERIINAPVYTVSSDGKTALTLDFSRLYNLRPGYGYYNLREKTEGEALPNSTAVWKINLETGEVNDLLTYKDFASFQPRSEMKEKGSVHKVNHLMLSPNGKRCMVLYRWFVGQRKYTRLVTFDIDGTNMYVLSDDDMVSHCFWKDNNHILAFENKTEGGPGYYLMKDKTQNYIHCWPELNGDGHPSYSPNGKMIVTDTYPDRARVASIRIMSGTNEKSDKVRTVAKVFAPFKYDNDTRCDLHPRWNRKGDMICFDSVFEGHRGLYVVNLSKKKKDKYPRVLVISNNCFSESTNNGRTLGNFFKGWPHDKLAQFYIKQEEPWKDVCEKYYCFTDKQVLNMLLHRKDQPNMADNNSNKDSTGVGKNAVTMIIRALLWKFIPWENMGFAKFVNNFKPEAVLLQAGDTIFMYDLAYKIAKKRRIPLYIYNSEDHVLREKNYFDNTTLGNIVYPIFHFWLKNSFWRTMKHTKTVIYISDKLKDTYNKIMKHNSEVIYTSTELLTSFNHAENCPLKVSYFGNMDFDRDSSLIELAEAFNESDKRIVIETYGRFPAEIQNRLQKCKAIDIKGFVSYDKLKEVIENSDIIVHIESFSEYYAQFNDHYFSTKIADCLVSGKPFLVYAPAKIAFVEYLKNNDAAIIISDTTELKTIVNRTVNDSDYRKSKIINAINVANRNHNVDTNRRKFQSVLINR
ncbi:Glycosyltransferase involved in cell wall bisynthesis [Ruminococcus sp. YE71]|uniref:glycosyltransferase family 1 protein n=1 Tax=unclassified Ruminococcus TaxID=2608920 RepID=UPI00088AF10E|nr:MULTISPECIES: glycosyltransferase family 1 protein [unclassified Ruminococcus]SDA11385.1 Glycosyltransferase involved in cell wall bisynthesis [Ruminococcus sp. YE78]SFW15163.1 Glycosyltransferase involved in cell wall bisynthesis [Ruminococcus sp. YE71]